MSDTHDLRRLALRADAEAADLRVLARRLDDDRERGEALFGPLRLLHVAQNWAGLAATNSRDRLEGHERDLGHLDDLLGGLAADLRARAGAREDAAAVLWDRWRDAQAAEAQALAEAGVWG